MKKPTALQSDGIAPAAARWYFVLRSMAISCPDRKEMSILKTTGLVAGHYECRSLAETLPAMEVVERTVSLGTLKHPNTEWRLIVHEGGPNAPEKSLDNHYGFRVGAQHGRAHTAGHWNKPLADNGAAAGITELGKLDAIDDKTSFIFSDPDRNWWELNA